MDYDYKNSKLGRATARKYADILHANRPDSAESRRRHPRMSLQNRAKIFSPFAALRGYDDQLAEEKQRSRRVQKRSLTEEEITTLSDKLMQVTKGMTVTVEYFKEDTMHPEMPPVGEYCTLTGPVEAIDPVYRTLRLAGEVVPFEALSALRGDGILDIDAYLGISPEE